MLQVINADEIDIVIAGCCLLVTLISLWCDPFRRLRAEVKRLCAASSCPSPTPLSTESENGEMLMENVNASAADEKDTTAEGMALPPLAIVLTPHRQAEELARHLPLLLEQDYPAGYQVIVVREESDRETDDVLKRVMSGMKQQSKDGKLYVTTLQDSSRFVSRKKLAITLGMKAAQTDWVVLMEADCRPCSDRWLATMACQCHPSIQMVMGYTYYAKDARKTWHFQRLTNSLYFFREVLRGTAYSVEGANVMVRKSLFMQENGYLGNLQWAGGAYHFLVNKLATRDNTALALEPSAWLEEQTPSQRDWLDEQMYYQETRRHLQRSFRHRLSVVLDQVLLHLSFWGSVALTVWSGYMQQWLGVMVGMVALLLLIVTKSLQAQRVARMLCVHCNGLLLFYLHLTACLRHAVMQWRHWRTDAITFTTHKQ